MEGAAACQQDALGALRAAEAPQSTARTGLHSGTRAGVVPATEWRRPAALYCRLGSLRRGAHEFAAERRIASAIRPDLKHANTRLRQSGNQSREMRPIPHDDMSGSVGGTQAPELHFLRRGEELSNGGSNFATGSIRRCRRHGC